MEVTNHEHPLDLLSLEEQNSGWICGYANNQPISAANPKLYTHKCYSAIDAPN